MKKYFFISVLFPDFGNSMFRKLDPEKTGTIPFEKLVKEMGTGKIHINMFENIQVKLQNHE